jgi:hypothetical protein
MVILCRGYIGSRRPHDKEQVLWRVKGGAPPGGRHAEGFAGRCILPRAGALAVTEAPAASLSELATFFQAALELDPCWFKEELSVIGKERYVRRMRHQAGSVPWASRTLYHAEMGVKPF